MREERNDHSCNLHSQSSNSEHQQLRLMSAHHPTEASQQTTRLVGFLSIYLGNDSFHQDIYVCSVSAAHNVSAKDKWLAFISTTAETDNHEAELQAAFNLIGPVEEKFIYAQDVFHPKTDQPAGDNVRFAIFESTFFICQV